MVAALERDPVRTAEDRTGFDQMACLLRYFSGWMQGRQSQIQISYLIPERSGFGWYVVAKEPAFDFELNAELSEFGADLTRRGPLFGADSCMLDAVACDTRGPVDELELSEAKAGLHAGLDRLKTEDRETLEAFYMKGRSLKQMAREFDAPVGTIKRRLHVARHRLKEVLEADPPVRRKPKRTLAAV